MIKLILFDAYGTLFNEGREVITDISKQIGERFKEDPEIIFKKWKKEYLSLEKQFGNRFMTIVDANLLSLKKTFNFFGFPVEKVPAYVDIIRERWSNPKLFDDVISEIINLSKYYEIGILSNGDEETLKKAIINTSLPIKYLATSERLGIYKPNPKIFSKVSEETGFGSREIVYVGNSNVDIIGAKKAGLLMIHLNRHKIKSKFEGFKADYIIENMKEIRPILKKF